MFSFLIFPLTSVLVPSASSEAYCANDGVLEKSYIDDNILSPINSKRSKLAKGELTDKTSTLFPNATAMNKLKWSCKLEKKAIVSLDTDCGRTKQPPVDKTMNAGLYYESDDGYPVNYAVISWLDQHKKNDFNLQSGTTAVTRPSNKCGSFSNLMHDETTEIGCAELSCESGKRYVFCLTDKPAVAADGEIYKVDAKPCSGCKKKTAPCNKTTKLCEAPEQSTTEATTEAATTATTEAATTATTEAATTATTTATTETTTKATTTATTETTTKATTKATTETTTTTAKATTTTEASYPGELPTGTNTRCPSNVGMTDELRMHFLDTQNYRRSILAKGQVQRINNNSLPTGANILKLDLNCSLENEAIKEVRECPTSKPRNPNTDMYGKNFDTFASSAVVPTYRDAIKKAVTNWWKVVRTETNVPGVNQVTFRLNHVNQPVESFTQIAWANTRYIGCAIAKCSSSYTVICLYYPKGNIVDQPIYTKGIPCDACPTTCDSALGLCLQ